MSMYRCNKCEKTIDSDISNGKAVISYHTISVEDILKSNSYEGAKVLLLNLIKKMSNIRVCDRHGFVEELMMGHVDHPSNKEQDK